MVKSKKILLQGYIGHKNFGDDLLLEIALKRVISIPDAQIYVALVGNKKCYEYLYKFYPNLNVLKFEKKIPLLFNLKFDKVFFIGGGVFFDYKKEIKNKSFYVRLFSNFIRYSIPKLFGTHFAGIGIGIGPYFSNKTKKIHAQVIRNFDILGVRDEVSYELALSMGAKNLHLSNDLSLCLHEELEVENHNEKRFDEIIICPRTYKHRVEFEKHIEELIAFAEYVENRGFKTHWIFLQEDEIELQNLIETKFRVTIWNPNKMKTHQFIDLFRKAKVVFTSRMHTIFIAGMVNTPIITIPVHQKLIYASSLFYDKPIIVNPLSYVDEYIKAFQTYECNKLNLLNLNKEVKILNALNSKVDSWFAHR